MPGAAPSRSPMCARGDHERCPHSAGARVRAVWRPRRRPVVVLTVCACPCHDSCPLAGERTVAEDDWSRRCTCAGAVPSREARRRALERRQLTTARVAQLLEDGHRDAGSIEAGLASVYAEAGEAVPPQLAGWSRVVAASTARRGTRTPRLLWMGARATGRTIHWAWQRDATGDRGQFRPLLAVVGAGAGVAALATAAAVTSSGRRRLPWTALAAALWLAVARTAALGAVAAAVVRGVQERRPA